MSGLVVRRQQIVFRFLEPHLGLGKVGPIAVVVYLACDLTGLCQQMQVWGRITIDRVRHSGNGATFCVVRLSVRKYLGEAGGVEGTLYNKSIF